MKKVTKNIQFLYFLIINLTIFISCNLSSNSGNNDNPERDTTNLETVKDIDGNIYHIVEIGEHVWLKENLKVTHYRNGDPIPHLKDATEWNNDKKGAFCNYDNNPENGKEYGRLYNWYVINDKRSLCPTGWHVATYDEFSALCGLYGGALDCGKYLKEAGPRHWEDNSGATNISGFTSLPGGHRNEKGFGRQGSYAFFWNKEEYKGDECLYENGNGCAYECSFQTGFYFNHDWGSKNRGMSIRCVKDSI